MAIIWVHIDPVVSADGDAAKGALKTPVKSAITEMLLKYTSGALSADRYSTKSADKPTGDGTVYNAIKITPHWTFKLDSKGSLMKLDSDLKMVFETIRTPNLRNGNLLGHASSGALVEKRGTGDRAVIDLAGQALGAIVASLVKKVITNPHFTSYGRSLNLPL